jgi:hypothetical protein
MADGCTSAVQHLLRHLPNNLHGLWLEVNQLHDILKRGGFPLLPKSVVVKCMRGNREDIPQRDRFGHTRYYQYGQHTTRTNFPKCFKEQRDSGTYIPDFIDGFFLQEGGNFFPNEVQLLKSKGYCQETTTSNVQDETPEIVAAEKSNLPESNESENKENKKPAGLKIVDIDVDDDFILENQAHAMTCRRRMHRVSQTKMGFDLVELWTCNYCKLKIRRRSGKDANPLTSKRGPKPSELNIIMTTAFFEAGVGVRKAIEVCANAGISSPTARIHGDYVNKMHTVARNKSEEQLETNRREHVLASRSLPDYPGDMQFNGRSVSRGPISMDGAGTKRAYCHRITGSQHILAVFSALTSKPIYVQCDQTSCLRCSRKLTEHIKATGKKVGDYLPGDVDLTHEGKCYRNSCHSPASAEEFAAADAGKYLMSLPDDEAIFGDEVITDGDTRSPNKFIDAQAEIVGPAAAGAAERIPDIGHFIKTVSNGLYKAASDDPTLKGKDLLEPARIKMISSDLATHLRNYHDKSIGLAGSPGTTTSDQNEIDAKRTAARMYCLECIDSLIPHHSGNHELCKIENCLYMKKERSVLAEIHALGLPVPPESDFRREVSRKYAESARFKGKQLSLNEQAIRKVSKIITSRVNETNVDRLAKSMSSNSCENFFGQLTKHTEGKRRNLASSLEVTVLFVAGMRSDPDICTKILKAAGAAQSSIIRDKRRARILADKERSVSRQKTPEYKARRMYSKNLKLIQVGKDAKSTTRHKSEKMAPTDNVRDTEARAPRKQNKCGNCGFPGHTKAQCAATERERPAKKAKKGVLSNVNLVTMLNL